MKKEKKGVRLVCPKCGRGVTVYVKSMSAHCTVCNKDMRPEVPSKEDSTLKVK